MNQHYRDSLGRERKIRERQEQEGNTAGKLKTWPAHKPACDCGKCKPAKAKR